MKSAHILCLIAVATVAVLAGPARAETAVAVFNFQMKSNTPEWKWAEKGLADKIVTDFTRSRRITVVARDEMQLMANKVRWAPEMATSDPERMEQIERQLEIDRLVTGVYSVRDGRVEITAQIVDVKTRTELVRKVVAGPVKDILTLQRKLSAEMLSWFSGVPASEIFSALPVWTESIESTKALYEGLHLYDQGRYAEAWLRFRQAWRNDPSYLEAHYWVGRMYYFMDRYKHARRAYEAFVYMDATHPRLGDAIKEYLHTYEKLDTPAEQMLTLYADFMRRFPEVIIHNEMDAWVPVNNREWLQVRSAQVLRQLGRQREGTLLASKAMATMQKKLWAYGGRGWAHRVAAMNAQDLNMLTGEVLMPPGLYNIHSRYEDSYVVQFPPGANEVVYRLENPRYVPSSKHKDGRTVYRWRFMYYYIALPSNRVLKKLTLYPIVRGTDGSCGVTINKEHGTVATGGIRSVDIDKAVKDGIVFEDLPRGGILSMNVNFHGKDKWRNPKLYFYGFRAVGEFEDVPVHGAIDVACSTTDNFNVYVDGRMARKGIGLVGLLPPGKRKVELRPLFDNHPFAAQTYTVTVEAGKVTPLQARLTYKPGHPLARAGWTTGRCVGINYPSRSPCLQTLGCPPFVLADDEAIRVFWASRGDLWWSVSADGDNFTRPAKLPMPISSGWLEQTPQCLRDESGRFLLAFLSDRGGQRAQRAYLCWSRDGKTWSRPAMVVDRGVEEYHIIQDARGRYIWADGTDKTATLLQSVDGYRWEPLAIVPMDDTIHDIKLQQRRDGTYEMFVVVINHFTSDREGQMSELVVWRYHSKDGAAWKDREVIMRRRWEDDLPISLMHINGRTVLSVLRRGTDDVRMFREQPDGSWQKADDIFGASSALGMMTHHPRWGYMMVWRRSPYIWEVRPEAGPYLIRGKSVEEFFEVKTVSAGTE